MIVMNTETNITPINEDLNIVKYEANNIRNLIYYIRGKQVILDRDLAELYNCKNGTKTINQAVKRNIENKKFALCFYRTGSCNASHHY